MDINLVELWAQMGLPVRGVVIVLTLQAIFSLSVIVDRVIALFRAERASRHFAKAAAPLMESAAHVELHSVGSQLGGPGEGTDRVLVLDRGGPAMGDDRRHAGDAVRRASRRRTRPSRRGRAGGEPDHGEEGEPEANPTTATLIQIAAGARGI